MKIALVTPGYLSTTPRVVREAEALTMAGHDVRVVFTQGPLLELRASDEDIVRRARWRISVFRWAKAAGFGERVANLYTGARHRTAQYLAAHDVRFAGLAERAEGRTYSELARLASAERADLYIGHYPAGLAAAAVAARRYGTKLGYDIEDLYAETFPPSDTWRPIRESIMEIERRYVPECAHLTAVSVPVAEEFARRYSGPVPVAVHNCHPWADRARIDRRCLERQGSDLSLFWFSQTVGLDRGLQDAIRAAGMATRPVQIHVRGSVSEDVRRELMHLAAARGIAGRLHFHPTCPPDELLSRAAEHDVGLALEASDALNRHLAVTNKLFLYLTGGLAVVATDLPGQRTILETCPAAGALYPIGDVRTLAFHLDHWSANPSALAAARKAALEAARTRWSAEAEARHLVSAVERLVSAQPSAPAANEAPVASVRTTA